MRQGMTVEKLAAELRIELWQLRVILEGDGRQLDPYVVESLAAALGVQPIDISEEA